MRYFYAFKIPSDSNITTLLSGSDSVGTLCICYIVQDCGGLHQDEAFVLLNSYDLLHEGRDSAGYAFPIYMSSWGDGQSAMYSWLLTPLLLLNEGIPHYFSEAPQALVVL